MAGFPEKYVSNGAGFPSKSELETMKTKNTKYNESHTGPSRLLTAAVSAVIAMAATPVAFGAMVPVPVASDGELILYSNSVTNSTGGSSLLAGRASDGGLSLAYFIFQLPTLLALGGNSIGSAEFDVGFIGTSIRRSNATLRIVNETFASLTEIGISSPNNGLLHTRVTVDPAFIPMTDAGGATAIASSRSPDLIATLNTLYSGGANAGRYVVFDISYSGSFPAYPADLDPMTNEAGYLFDTTSSFAPYQDSPAMLTISGIPEPTTSALFGAAAVVALSTRRKTREALATE